MVKKQSTGRIFLVLLLGWLITYSGCKSADSKDLNSEVANPKIKQIGDMFIFDPDASNTPEASAKPYVILVSIDGYRFDYNKMFAPPNLSEFAKKGFTAESLRPAYPSKTFPSHYSIVTGLYPEHHGIVSNEFYDPYRNESYSLSDQKSSEDGTWYFGEPIWITAQKQGMLTASYFWVGTEADIQGWHPNYYFHYDDKVPYEKRVDQALSWLRLPVDRRPHLISLYFEGVDQAAHKHGTKSPDLRAAVAEVDSAFGRLLTGVKESGLPVNIIVVSDHGMQDLDSKKVYYLDDFPWSKFLLSKFQLVGRGPQMLLYLKPGGTRKDIDEAQKLLRREAHGYRVWKREEMDRLHYRATPRVGDLVIEPDMPYLIGIRSSPPAVVGANHGWDPYKYKNMHGVFFAGGPLIKPASKSGTVDTIDIYPFLLELLRIKQRVPIDGKLGNLYSVIVEEPPKP